MGYAAFSQQTEPQQMPVAGTQPNSFSPLEGRFNQQASLQTHLKG